VFLSSTRPPVVVLAVSAFADERARGSRPIQEEVWAIPVTLPTIAYVVRPVGKGSFPARGHEPRCVSLNQRERGFFPLVEFRGRGDVVRSERLHGRCALRYRIWRSRTR